MADSQMDTRHGGRTSLHFLHEEEPLSSGSALDFYFPPVNVGFEARKRSCPFLKDAGRNSVR